jgi:hypothetical protein
MTLILSNKIAYLGMILIGLRGFFRKKRKGTATRAPLLYNRKNFRKKEF